MIKGLMHNLMGGNAAQTAIAGGGLANTMTTQQITAAMQSSMLNQIRQPRNKRVFHGNIEVQQVANGYVVQIGTREGYEYETHIAQTIAEVNAIIAAQIVAFRLEDK